MASGSGEVESGEIERGEVESEQQAQKKRNKSRHGQW